MRENLRRFVPCAIIVVIAITFFCFWLIQKSMLYNVKNEKMSPPNKMHLKKMNESFDSKLEQIEKMIDD